MPDPTLTLVDNFNYTGLLNTGSWAPLQLEGGASSDVAYANGTYAEQTSGSIIASSYYTTTRANNVGVFGTIAYNTDDVELILCWYLNGTGTSTTGYYVAHRQRPASTDTLRIGIITGGARSVLNSVTQNLSVGDIFGGIRDPGTGVITFWQKIGSTWTPVFTYTDSTYTSGGYMGIELSVASIGPTTGVDDFSTGVVSSVDTPQWPSRSMLRW